MRGTRRAEIFIDGACAGNPGPAGIGVVLTDGSAKARRELSKYLGEATNNIAEYLALVYALQEALQLGYHEVLVNTDSELLVKQTRGEYKVRNPQLRWLHDVVMHLAKGFRTFRIEHIPRTKNTRADRLAGQAIKQRLIDN